MKKKKTERKIEAKKKKIRNASVTQFNEETKKKKWKIKK